MKNVILALISMLFVACAGGGGASSKTEATSADFYGYEENSTKEFSGIYSFRSDGVFEIVQLETDKASGVTSFIGKECGTFTMSGTIATISYPGIPNAATSDLSGPINGNVDMITGPIATLFSQVHAKKSYIQSLVYPGYSPCP